MAPCCGKSRRAANYARTDFDRTLSYVQSYVYQLPAGVGKRWLNSGPAAWCWATGSFPAC